MLLSAVSIAAGAFLLWVGAEGLVRGSASIARRLGLSPLVIGLTVVAAGTSMPELVVSVRATLADGAPIAVGNAVGSNIANIGLILGVGALIRPLRVDAKLLKLDVPLLLAVTVALVLLIRDDRLGRVEGAVFVVLLVGYVAFSLWAARSEPETIQAEFAEGVPTTSGSTVYDVFAVALGMGALVVGARFLVFGASEVARGVGVSEATIGLTVVAFGTSLPELATSAIASARGEGDIAVGNVIGSNLFNLLGILGIAALVRPLEPTGMTVVDLSVLVGATVLFVPLMRTGFQLVRWEGALLLGGYLAYVIWLFL